MRPSLVARFPDVYTPLLQGFLQFSLKGPFALNSKEHSATHAAYQFYATAAFGMEGIVASELRRLGLQDAKGDVGGCRFTGSLEDAFLCCLRLRCADRVLLVLAEGTCLTFDDLFRLTGSVPWQKYLTRDGQINVSCKCGRSQLMSISDCQSICKKSIIEQLRKSRGQDVFPESGVPFPIHVHIHENHTRIMLDLCGSGLSRRGYRTWNGEAPLRETLAAALVELSPWRPGMPLHDPCCGTGTLPIEAAFRAGHRAPGMTRTFACEQFPFVPKERFCEIRKQVESEFEIDRIHSISGSDLDPEALELARRHVHQAGLDGVIQLHLEDLRTLTMQEEEGVFLCNPPYGERMSDRKKCAELYAALCDLMRRNPGWSLCAISSDPDFERAFGKRADKRRKLYNGRLECQFYIYLAPAEKARAKRRKP